MTLTIPTLETERLVLRGWHLDDLAPLAALYSDHDDLDLVHVGGPLARNAVWRVLCLRAGHWQLRGHGQFAVIEKASGVFLGWCGSLHHDEDAEPELHYGMTRQARGQGYATEAVASIVDHALRIWRLPHLSAWIRPENIASQRVVAKAGAGFVETTERFNKPAQLWCFRPAGGVA